WYQVGGRRAMVRSTIEAVVLEEIYRLANVPPPAAGGDPAYPGYPLRAGFEGALWIFYAAWPAAPALAFLWIRGPWRKRGAESGHRARGRRRPGRPSPPSGSPRRRRSGWTSRKRKPARSRRPSCRSWATG